MFDARRYLVRTDGNIAMTFAILAPALLALGGSAIDLTKLALIQQNLQQIADDAAIAGAREYALAPHRQASAMGFAMSADSQGKKKSSIPEEAAKSRAEVLLEDAAYYESEVDPSADPVEKTVTMDLSYEFKPSFLTGMFKKSFVIAATATAVAYDSANLCVISLDTRRANRIILKDRAKLSGPECAVQVNSDDPKGLAVLDVATMQTAGICAAGGYDGPDSNYAPTPLTDCPTRGDPLADRPQPTVSATCDADKTDLVLTDFSGGLSPGTYCGGLTIEGASDVTLAPGNYVFTGGNLVVQNTARIAGENVSLIFNSDGSRFLFLDEANVDLSAPAFGSMAGLLAFQRRGASETDFEIKSNNVDRLVGTIYLTKGDLIIDATDDIAEASAFTAIISDELIMSGSANLVINSDYDATNVPLPPTLAGLSQVSLRQ